MKSSARPTKMPGEYFPKLTEPEKQRVLEGAHLYQQAQQVHSRKPADESMGQPNDQMQAPPGPRQG